MNILKITNWLYESCWFFLEYLSFKEYLSEELDEKEDGWHR